MHPQKTYLCHLYSEKQRLETLNSHVSERSVRRLDGAQVQEDNLGEGQAER